MDVLEVAKEAKFERSKSKKIYDKTYNEFLNDVVKAMTKIFIRIIKIKSI